MVTAHPVGALAGPAGQWRFAGSPLVRHRDSSGSRQRSWRSRHGRLERGPFAGLATNGQVGGSGHANLSRFCHPRQTAAKLGPKCRSTWSLIAAPATILAEEPRPGWSAAFLPAWQLTTKLGPQDPPTCRGFANPANGGQVGAEMKGNLVISCRPGNDPGRGEHGPARECVGGHPAGHRERGCAAHDPSRPANANHTSGCQDPTPSSLNAPLIVDIGNLG